MNQAERRIFLIQELLREEPRFGRIAVPDDRQGQKDLLRSLMNVRPPRPIGSEFAAVQDAYLQEAIAEKGVTELSDLTPVEPGFYLWRGDITTLRCGAIVNAANSGMTGCYQPCHNCIDNCIHTYAGIQLRSACAELMEAQGYEEPTGQAKITPAYNLPCRYVLHTVGPIVGGGTATAEQETQLASCYRACLALAAEHNVKSVAFCCISTGVFGFPRRRAAEIAVETVRACRAEHNHSIEVIFNVFSETDEQIYRAILG
ncbi:MAG: protein-ADP-ribose hydrolase [Ruminococcaceae bacterium]|nr:protein-ADP-ribose hydrolase [Oscillospiraceae bacterium]